MWEAADRAIREMNRANLRAFGKLKLAKWDELNVLRVGAGGSLEARRREASVLEIRAIYEASIRLAKKKYLEVYADAYYECLLEMGYGAGEAKNMAAELDDDWLIEFLEDADPVTLYAFIPEADRKMMRLVEALAVVLDINREVDKALRAWTFQVGQYTDNSVIKGRTQAMKDAGVQYVRWHTQEDERVCEDCEPLDGKVFPIDAMPQIPQHPRCRCWISPA